MLVNTSRQVYIERHGKLEATTVIFRDDAHLLQIIDRIVSKVGRRVDESSPMVDARLPDGSRVNAIIPPLALDGPIMSIRRFGRSPLMMDDLCRVGAITPEMVMVLQAMVRARLNILVSGGTGSGKTTLLNALSSFIPDGERIVTIEDSAELQLQQPHVVRLEMMMQMCGFELPSRAMRQQISSALDLVVQTARLSDGTRKIMGITEVVGMEGDTIMLQDLFTYVRDGVDKDGRTVGRFCSTGLRPKFTERLKASSHEIDPKLFEYLN